MKKAYTAPKIYYESFALSTSISAGCEGIANLSEGQCTVTVPDLGIEIFTIDLVCQVTAPGTDDTICFHVPADWNNVYSS